MKAHRHFSLPADVPQRRPVVATEARQTQRDRVVRKADGAAALVGEPLGFRDARIDVPDRQQPERDQPVRSTGTPLVDLPVVPGFDAELGKFLVLRAMKDSAGKSWEGGEAQGPVDAVDVHVGHARLGVVATGDHVGILDRLHAEVFGIPSRDGVDSDVREELTLVLPGVVAFGGGDDLRAGTLVSLGKPVPPDPRVLNDVVVDRDDLHVVLERQDDPPCID